MPVHAGEAWLRPTLESLAGEAEPGIEVLFFDSSPDERSSDVAREFASRIDIVIERRPDLLGWTEKTNAAVELARAPHVAMLHQDDLWLPGRTAALRRWIEADPEAVLHLGPTQIVDSKGRKRGVWNCPLPRGRVPEATLVARLPVQNFISVPAPVFRRDAYLAVGGMDPSLWYTPDWDLWIKLSRFGVVRHHADVTSAFRVHGGSLTMTGSRSLENFEDQMRIVLDRHAEWYADRAPARAMEASIRVNLGLAAAAAGKADKLIPALRSLVALGPVGLVGYLHSSRIAERLMPRLRCKLAGEL
ncbi:glycosyltransferase [Novosphingobium sp. 9U]|uniref:glycosyltransferase n=1 Tax=Novosphingobium sp. 9U TaxID=2653158 RepID=UPI0013571FB2|nr:glycosyltransferase [Novosphingobium sp. 9U]